jgi:hypothetical protein
MGFISYPSFFAESFDFVLNRFLAACTLRLSAMGVSENRSDDCFPALLVPNSSADNELAPLNSSPRHRELPLSDPERSELEYSA